MNWLTVDIASKSGWAFWNGDKLEEYGIIRKRGKKGAWLWHNEATDDTVIHDSKFDCFENMLMVADYCIYERARGGMRNADYSLGTSAGYLQAMCDYKPIPHEPITNSEWRRIVKEQTGLSWPTGKSKEHCQRLVKSIYGVDASEDASDAILLGYAVIKSGRVPE